MNDYLMQKKSEMQVDLIKKQFESQLQGMRAEINELRDQVQQLRRQSYNQSQAPAPLRPVEQPQQAQAAPAQQWAPQPARVAPQPVARQADRTGFSPGEVSIEKMFYCGNKR
ncbi:MAG: hypothetical protein ABIH41_03595 [Nanoarchaeota archaeon]